MRAMNKIEAFLLSPTFLSFLGFALLLLLTLWLLNTVKMPPKRGPHLRNWLRGNYWLAMVVAGLTLGGAAAFFYLVEIGISVRAIVDRLVTAAADPSTPAEDLRNLGTATGILLAALAAAATLVFQLVRVWITERQTVAAEQGLITDRINKAVEGLGAEKVVTRTLKDPSDLRPLADNNGAPAQYNETLPNIEVRVGAILSLERIAQNSSEDNVPIMEMLCTYLRSNAPAFDFDATTEPPNVKLNHPNLPTRNRDTNDLYPALSGRKRADIATIMEVLARRTPEQFAAEAAWENLNGKPFRLNLSDTDLSGMEINHGNLTRLICYRSNFAGSILRNLCLEQSFFEHCDFTQTIFDSCRMKNSRFELCDLVETQFLHSDLRTTLWMKNTFDVCVFEHSPIDNAGFYGLDLNKHSFATRQDFFEVTLGELTSTLDREHPNNWIQAKLDPLKFEQEWMKWEMNPANYRYKPPLESPKPPPLYGRTRDRV